VLHASRHTSRFLFVHPNQKGLNTFQHHVETHCIEAVFAHAIRFFLRLLPPLSILFPCLLSPQHLITCCLLWPTFMVLENQNVHRFLFFTRNFMGIAFLCPVGCMFVCIMCFMCVRLTFYIFVAGPPTLHKQAHICARSFQWRLCEGPTGSVDGPDQGLIVCATPHQNPRKYSRQRVLPNQSQSAKRGFSKV
jgi:hypothetical protein